MIYICKGCASSLLWNRETPKGKRAAWSFFKNAPYSFSLSPISHLFFSLERGRECSIPRSPRVWIPMRGGCACKVILASSSPPTPSPASDGPSSFMNVLSTPSPSSEAPIVSTNESLSFICFETLSGSIFLLSCYLHAHLSRLWRFNDSWTITNLDVWCDDRGDAEDHHEGDGCEGSHSLPSQEPSPGSLPLICFAFGFIQAFCLSLPFRGFKAQSV